MLAKVVKISEENLKAVGATSVADFDASLTAFISKAKAMAENKVTLESLQASITALESRLLSEDRIKAIVGDAAGPVATNAIKAWAASDEGKKIIGAEASRITAESLGAVGTIPARPAPLSGAGVETPEQKSAALISAGKYEEAYAADPNLRNEFPTAKHFAAFARNAGAVKISQKN